MINTNILGWFLSISGFLLGLYGAIIGTWDLFVDLQDRKQGKNTLKITEVDEDGEV